MSIPKIDIIRPSRTARGAVSPVYFCDATITGLTVPDVTEFYLNWIEGTKQTARRRRELGVPERLDRQLLLQGSGTTLRGTKGVSISTRISKGTVVIRFVHKDSAHPDVEWHSVARITASADSTDSLIRVEHASGRRVPPYKALPPVAGAPAVLKELLKSTNWGVYPRELSEREVVNVRQGEAAEFVRHVILDSQRTLPVVVVSKAKESGELLVNPKTLAERLFGQATVALVHEDATFEFTTAFEEQGFRRELGSCFDGAVRVYHADIKSRSDHRAHFLWLPHRLRAWEAAATQRLAGEVAQRSAWRSVPSRFFALVETFDRAERRAQSRQALDSVGAPSGIEQKLADVSKRLEESLELEAEWEAEVKDLQVQLDEASEAQNDLEQQRDEAQQSLFAAEARLVQFQTRETGIDGDRLRVLGDVAASRVQSLSDALLAIETIFPNRVHVLSSAQRSAEESALFKKPQDAFLLLRTLVSEYLDQLQGNGDAVARKVFTDKEYAARESETVEGRASAMARRTFRHHGEDVEMLRHLKIGNKDSAATTWRCHFAVEAPTADEEPGRIIIGHCGKHLDFK